MLSSRYPFDVDYEVGDLVLISRSIEYMGFYVEAGEIAIVVDVYDRGHLSKSMYDCRILLKCGKQLDCWLGEIINLCKLHVDK